MENQAGEPFPLDSPGALHEDLQRPCPPTLSRQQYAAVRQGYAQLGGGPQKLPP